VTSPHRVQGVPERGVSISPVSNGSKEKCGFCRVLVTCLASTAERDQ
jgi:hypothetical protein